jgi:hypothetical protein
VGGPPVVLAGAAAAVDARDPDADTVTDIPQAWPADAPGQRTAQPAQRSGPPGAMLAVGALALAIVAFLALTSLLGDGEPGSSGGPSAPVGASASASASPVASASATPEPTPTPDPTPAPDPAADALAALDRVDAAIEGLADEDGVKKKDLDAIRKRARDVRKALEADNYGQARDHAARLGDEVDKLDERVDGNAMEALQAAVSDLEGAIPAG